MATIRGISDPGGTVEVTVDGSPENDLAPTSGVDLVIQKIIRGLLTRPGEIHHRPRWGAGLRDYQNKPPTDDILQEIANRVAGFLDTMEAVDEYKASVDHDADADETTITIRGKVRGSNFEIAGLTLGNP